MKSFKEYLEEAVTVSKSSIDHYEFNNGHKPKGKGSWMFSTVHPSKFDIDKHGYNTQSGTFSEAKKKAAAVFKSKGHSGEIHVLP